MFIDYITLMLINMVAGLFLLAYYLYKGLALLPHPPRTIFVLKLVSGYKAAQKETPSKMLFCVAGTIFEGS